MKTKSLPGPFAAHNQIDPKNPDAGIQFPPEDLMAAGERLMRRVQEGIKPASVWSIRDMPGSYSIIMRWQRGNEHRELDLNIGNLFGFGLCIYNDFTNAHNLRPDVLGVWSVRRLFGESWGKLTCGYSNMKAPASARITVEDSLFADIPRATSAPSDATIESEIGQHVIETVQRHLREAGIAA